MNWFKQSQMDLEFLGHNSYGNLRVLINGKPYTFYDVSPFWAEKLRWMIEKSKIPGEVIYQKHLKQFSDPKRHKELNPVPSKPKEPKKPQQGVLPFMQGNWFGKLLYASIWETDRVISIMNDISSGAFTEEWDEELQQIGISTSKMAVPGRV